MPRATSCTGTTAGPGSVDPRALTADNWRHVSGKRRHVAGFVRVPSYDCAVNRRELVIGLGAALAACKALRYRPNDPQPLDEHDLATLAAIADTFLPGPPS